LSCADYSDERYQYPNTSPGCGCPKQRWLYLSVLAMVLLLLVAFAYWSVSTYQLSVRRRRETRITLTISVATAGARLRCKSLVNAAELSKLFLLAPLEVIRYGLLPKIDASIVPRTARVISLLRSYCHVDFFSSHIGAANYFGSFAVCTCH